jgi:uncharacterized membrane protein YgdD (TMEM256/DUF423 family)
MSWIQVGALWGFLGVVFGAFGAHAIRGSADEQALSWWETAAQYHLVHALALVLAGLVGARAGRGGGAAWALLGGSVLFSGTLYAMALGAPRWLGAVTPLGGLGQMLGWLLLAYAARARQVR